MEQIPNLKVVQDVNEGEIVLAYLERTREEWSPHYRHAIRDGRMNRQLNAEADAFVPKMDSLLDELNALGFYAVANT